VASAIRPLRSRRRTAQRGKPMTQSQRWGKVTTMTPTPEGEITTSTTWIESEDPATEEDEALAQAILGIEDDERLVQIIEEELDQA